METIETYVCQESHFPGELIFNTLATIREHGQSEALTSFLSNDPYFAENFIKEVEEGKVEVDTEGLGRSLKKGLTAIKEFFTHNGTYGADLDRGWKRLDDTLAYLVKENLSSKMVRVVPADEVMKFVRQSLAATMDLSDMIEKYSQFKNEEGKVVTALDKMIKKNFKGDKSAQYSSGISASIPQRKSVDIMKGAYGDGSAPWKALDKEYGPVFKRMGSVMDVIFGLDFDNMPKEEYNVVNKLYQASEGFSKFLRFTWGLQIDQFDAIYKDVK